jgi:hypothetical protein
MPRTQCRGIDSLHLPAVTQAIPKCPRPPRALRATAKRRQCDKPAEPLTRHVIEARMYATYRRPHFSPQAAAGLNPARTQVPRVHRAFCPAVAEALPDHAFAARGLNPVNVTYRDQSAEALASNVYHHWTPPT